MRRPLALVTPFALIAALLLGAIAANAEPVLLHINTGPVRPGQSYEITFQFLSFPTNSEGDANILVISGGSVSLGVSATRIDLFVGDELAGTYLNHQPNSFGYFTQPGSRAQWGFNPTDLTSIWQGATARAVVSPVEFQEAVADPFVEYRVHFLYAARYTGQDSVDVGYADPIILSTRMLPANSAVPDPGSTLLLLGLSVIGLRTWKR